MKKKKKCVYYTAFGLYNEMLNGYFDENEKFQMLKEIE